MVTILQAAAVSRSVWSAWSLLPLWCAAGGPKAPASWTHSIRFAPFGCGRAALRCIADFQSAGVRQRLRRERVLGTGGSQFVLVIKLLFSFLRRMPLWFAVILLGIIE